jgi:Domain of unknown function (DUF3560)
MIEITHSAAEGTLITGDFRPHTELVKGVGFRWSRRESFWYLPNTRDRLPRTAIIEATADRLRQAGFTVNVTIDADMRPTAEREAARTERIEDRQNGLEIKAGKLAAESDQRYAAVRQMQDRIPFGQPILVGHHSEKRHRKDLARMTANMDKSVEAYRESKATESRLAGSVANQAHRESAPTTIRRIAKLEADLRKIERHLAGDPCSTSGRKLKADAEDRKTIHCPLCGTDPAVVDRAVATHYYHKPAEGAFRERQLARQADHIEQITYWKEHLASLEANGIKLWGPSDFKKGDFVNYWGGWREIVRVNAKTLSVKSDYSWTDKLPYDKVKERRDA